MPAVVLLLLPALAPPLQAQEKERDEEKECVRIGPWETVRVSPREGWTEVFDVGRRARLGVLVNTEANPETDRYGALITGVTKGGPADKAGLEKGDIITKLNGESLLSGGGVYDEDESAPGMRLIERARKLERGDTVEIEYRRDGKTRTTELVVGDFDDLWISGLGYSGRLRNLFERARELPEVYVRGPESFALRLGARLPGLELVSLNPELGEYFGADEGVLVVSVPEHSELKLKAGDVIKAIDGRKVKSPSHAMRILRSYDPDEEVSLEVLRKKKTITVKGKVPDPPSGGRKVLRIERR
jgi:predicted metalloprotease with PDZ domain